LREPSSKIATSLNDALERRARLPGKVVFTNGVFDLLHVGHIDLLTAARALGDRPGFVGLETKLKPKRLGADRNRLSGDARSLGGRSEDIDHVDGLPDVQERGIGLLAQDLSRVGIDRDDPIPTVLKEVGDMS